ncbi:GGDEF domain-containing protein [Pseudomonas sp. M47T1]|uniref:GGDEF domain-containing protein n=1 Tax=Pseudomonas sp. M47T1 TaxID=1179778 RepID=UPI0009D9B659|nr:GGDEF domain-containing protein [Pseudomonas sp. M47T1]
MGSRVRTLSAALRRAQVLVALLAAGLCAVLLSLLGVLAWRSHIADVLPAVAPWRVLLAGGCIALCTAIGTLSAVYVSRRLLRGIFDPLHNLAQVIEAARRQHGFEHRVPAAGLHDLDALGGNVNALLDELETWHVHAQGEPARQSSLDHLTGLPNRAFFEARLARNLDSAQKRQRQLAVLVIDADHFQAINEHHGHTAGDDVLISLAGRIRRELRENDLLARLGGDEFAVLLLLDSGERGEEAGHIADNIIAGLYAPIVLPNAATLTASLSIGVALSPEHGRTGAELMAAATAALHQAKHQGRGRWCQTQVAAYP